MQMDDCARFSQLRLLRSLTTKRQLINALQRQPSVIKSTKRLQTVLCLIEMRIVNDASVATNDVPYLMQICRVYVAVCRD